MKPIALIIAMLLVGCVSGNAPESKVIEREHSDIIVIGDSLCDDGLDWPGYAKISSDCKAGRASTAYHNIPQGRRVILYALITNDVKITAPNDYKAQIIYHFNQVDSDIICLVANPDFGDEYKTNLENLQDIMKTTCDRWIDMRDGGYLHRAPDGIHASTEDNQDFGNYILGLIEAGDI